MQQVGEIAQQARLRLVDSGAGGVDQRIARVGRDVSGLLFGILCLAVAQWERALLDTLFSRLGNVPSGKAWETARAFVAEGREFYR